MIFKIQTNKLNQLITNIMEHNGKLIKKKLEIIIHLLLCLASREYMLILLEREKAQ